MISPEAVKKSYAQAAESYDDIRFKSKAGKYRFKVEKRKLLNHLKGPKILELAAGTARYGIYFTKLGFDYTGVDFTPKMLEVGKERAKKEGLHLKLVEMDVHELAFKDNTFDSVFCDRAFKFFQEPVKVLEEAHRVLKPHGKMIANIETPRIVSNYWTKNEIIKSMIDKLSEYALTKRLGYHSSSLSLNEKFYSGEEMKNMFKLAGLKKIRIEQVFYVPLFLVQFIPSWLLHPLLKFEVNAKKRLLGSKIMVVGDK